jgi:transcriptional regulator with XRE-family HTH domain
MKRPKPLPIYDELRALTRLYMRKRNVTQTEMAKRLGVSPRTLQYWAFDAVTTSVLRERPMNELINLLRLDGLVALSFAAPSTKRKGIK